ncbi:MAG: ABC transporter ATP-binding protein [Lachnospiraceae bacterium]|nr:ABC transporter ATP-binding protein [Lachnospiraceae bacterium]
MDKPVIVFEKVAKNYGETEVLSDFSLEVNRGEIITMVGRSGCGKTTALKLVNGLIKPDSGDVYVEGRRVADCDNTELRRNIGYVIQGVGLFPHMTVEKNIAYVPSLTHKKGFALANPRAERGRSQFSLKGLFSPPKIETAQLLSIVGLEPDLAGRYPSELSGGQRQRVGIARAIAAQPDILLMDEPFGAVDEITRRALQDELLRLHSELGFTILFVTHDISEALKLGTRIMVMESGRVIQVGTADEIINNPANDFVRELVGGN